MTYEQTLKAIFSIKSFKGYPTLERIAGIMDYLNNPQTELRIVHVAGTNGKGSISTFISNILEHSGYKTGKFISPFIVDFRERIQINSTMIEKDELIDYYNLISMAQNKTGILLTQFEFITAMALAYFRDKKCDIVVLEVGIGGRFDATNVIETPQVAVIASISLDHTAILGDTVEQIAFEKAGIIKNKGDVVCYPALKTEVVETIKTRVLEENGELVIPAINQIANEKSDLFGSSFSYKGQDYTLKLLGKHQILNCVSALEAINILKGKGYKIEDDTVKQCIANTTFYCRQEKLGKNPAFLVDGAHNIDAVNVLISSLQQYGGENAVAVVSFMKDKDWKEILLASREVVRTFVFTKLEMPRALEFEDVKAFCKQHNINCVYAKDAKEALEIAKSYGEEMILVFGSLYLASAIRKHLTEKN